MNEINFKTIGYIKTPFEHKVGVPIQAKNGEEYRGEIHLHPEFEDGLKDLDGFTYAHLIYRFDRHDDYSLVTKPYMDDTPRGVFSTRAPKRPNPIGLSLVRIESVKGNIVSFTGVDILNETPLIDIKPYYHDFDSRDDAKCGWLDFVKNRRKVADDRF